MARNYADRVIRELKEGGGYDDPTLTMIVKNEARETVDPVLRGRARSAAPARRMEPGFCFWRRMALTAIRALAALFSSRQAAVTL